MKYYKDSVFPEKNIPLIIQKTVAKNAVKANGMPNHKLKNTGQICDQEPSENKRINTFSNEDDYLQVKDR